LQALKIQGIFGDLRNLEVLISERYQNFTILEHSKPKNKVLKCSNPVGAIFILERSLNLAKRKDLKSIF
jgi:hypothetical protein